MIFRRPTKPIHASFSITYRCNHHCFYCSPKKNGQLEEEDVVQVVRNLADKGILSVFLTGGEVFFREDFFSILKGVDKTAISFSIETNGTRIQKEEAEQLSQFDTLVSVIVCIDGTPPVHDTVHGRPGAFEKAVSAIKWLKSMGIPVEIHTVFYKENANVIGELIEIIYGMGIKKYTLLPLVGYIEHQASSEEYRALEMIVEKWRSEYSDFTILLRRNKKELKKNGIPPLYINPLGFASCCPYDEHCIVGNILEDTDYVLSSITAYYTTVCLKKCRRWKE